MSDFRSRVIVDLAGNLVRRSRAYTGAMRQFGRQSAGAIQPLRRTVAAAGRGLDSLANRYTALITGAAGAGAVRRVVQLDARLTQLGIQAGVSAEKVNELKERFFEIAQDPAIRIRPDQLIAGVEAIVERTGDLEFAADNLRNIGMAVRAAGATGQDIGALTAQLLKFDIVTNDQVLATLDTLVRQGKAGSFTLQNFAGQGERVSAAYAATGRTGPIAVREMGAVLQVIRSGTGSAEQAATAFEAVLRTLQNADKLEILQGNGIQVFEPDQPGVMRSVASIMEDVIAATDGSAVKISQVFDGEAMRAFNAAIAAGHNPFAQFMGIMGDGTQLTDDSQRAATTAAAAWDSLITTFERVADSNFAEPIQQMADALNSIDPETLGSLIKWGAGLGAAAVGLSAVSKGVRGLRSLGGRRGGGGLGGMAGATPVMVVNWPPGMGRAPGARSGPGGGAVAGAAGGAAAGGRFSRFTGRLGFAKRAGRLLSKAALPLTALFAAGDALITWADETASLEEKAGATGGGLGMVGGAAGGAALGTLVAPGPGTVIGGILGALLGEYGGSEAGEAVGRALDSSADGPGHRGTVRIEAENLPPGSAITATSDDVDLEAGVYMGALP